MSPETVAVLGRVIERILVTIAGTLCIWWGYGLLYIAVEKQSELDAQSGEKFRLRLKNVAPGLGFALFGMAILVFSLLSKVDAASPEFPASSSRTSQH